MITRSKELIVQDTMDVSIHRHENGQYPAAATLSFRSVNGSHHSSIYLSVSEATQLAEALLYIVATES